MKIVNISGYDCIFDKGDSILDLVVYVSQGYARVYRSSKLFSRIKMKVTNLQEVDHRNGNMLDNRTENLRCCSALQNSANRTVHKDKKSGLPKGVYKHRNKYKAQIYHRGLYINLGTFMYPEDAESAYQEKAEELHGKFASHISRRD